MKKELTFHLDDASEAQAFAKKYPDLLPAKPRTIHRQAALQLLANL